MHGRDDRVDTIGYVGRNHLGGKSIVPSAIALSLALHAAALGALLYATAGRGPTPPPAIDVALIPDLPQGPVATAASGSEFGREPGSKLFPLAVVSRRANPSSVRTDADASGSLAGGATGRGLAEKQEHEAATVSHVPPSQGSPATVPGTPAPAPADDGPTGAEHRPAARAKGGSPATRPGAAMNVERWAERTIGAPFAEHGPMIDEGLLRNLKPNYPYAARRRGFEGRATIRVEVLSTGAMKSVALLESSGYAILDNAALAAARKWRFIPARRAGLAVEGTIDVPIDFRLE